MIEAKENVTVFIKPFLLILLVVLKKVSIKPVVYISHPLNSYSVNPNDYKYLDIIPNLKRITIVSYTEHGYKTSEFEEAFIQIPIKVFYSLREAKKWGAKLIK